MSNDDQYGGGHADVGGTGQTRTRLPDAPADPYGTPRRTPRASRGLVTVVGVVVLLVAAIAFANQGQDGPPATPSADTPPAATSTAPTGTRPVDAKNGGVPQGFAHDEQGAQSAAANFAAVLGSDGMFDSARRRAIVQAVYVPDVAAARQSDLDRVYTDQQFLARIGLDNTGRAPKGLTFISRTNPLGTKAEKFGGDTATVSVWFSTLFGLAGEGSKNPVAESWYTNTFELRWINGDWRISDFTQKDGPAPVGRDQRAASAEEMAAAVSQFGGLTYAR